jgi:hypothetical protein
VEIAVFRELNRCVRQVQQQSAATAPTGIDLGRPAKASDAKIHSGQGFLGMRGPGLHLVPGQEVLARVTV